MNGTATFIRSLTDWHSDARLYRVEPPARYCHDYGTGTYGHTSHVIVSAIRYAFDTGRPETMVFPADSHGVPVNMSEMFVTYTYDHTAALAGLDYWPSPDPYTRSHPTDGPYSHADVCGFDRVNGSPCPHLPAPDPDTARFNRRSLLTGRFSGRFDR